MMFADAKITELAVKLRGNEKLLREIAEQVEGLVLEHYGESFHSGLTMLALLEATAELAEKPLSGRKVQPLTGALKMAALAQTSDQVFKIRALKLVEKG